MRGGGPLTNLALLCLLALAFASGWVAFELSGQPARATLGTSSVYVRSVTGYGRRFDISEASRLLLATRLDGATLESGHGFPVRLVAPGRRGFAWVKWVVSVETDTAPWWWQPPFPLQ